MSANAAPVAAPVTAVEVETATVYKVRVRHAGGYMMTWADIAIREWEQGGSISVVSDFGTFANVWGSIGDRTLREFLVGVDYGYFMEKAHPSFGYEWDADAARERITADITAAADDQQLSAEEATDLLRELGYVDGLGSGETGMVYFVSQLSGTKILELLYGSDPSCVPRPRRREPSCDAFWKTIWPVACDYWRRELGLVS